MQFAQSLIAHLVCFQVWTILDGQSHNIANQQRKSEATVEPGTAIDRVPRWPSLPPPVGDPENSRSAARRSLDELMASRLGESRDVWRNVLGPLLERDEACRLLGVGSGHDIDVLVRDKQLLALPTHEGDTVFPAFQFGRDGKPYPVISRVIDILDPVVESPYMIASWLKSRKADLGDRTPIEWLELGRDPRRIVAEARQSAAHLAHS